MVRVNRLFAFVYPNRNDDSEGFNARKYYFHKGIIKSYNVIISGTSFYGQPIDSDIYRYKEIRKLATG